MSFIDIPTEQTTAITDANGEYLFIAGRRILYAYKGKRTQP